MAVSVGIAAVATSTAVGLKSARDQKKLGKAGLRIAKGTQAKQDYYDQKLRELIENPASIKQDPGYEFAFDEGLQAVERSNAARGFAGSGNAAVDLQRFGQSFASNFLKQREDLLAGLSGATQSAAGGLAPAVSANASSTDILSQTLASLGYTFGKGGFGRNPGTGGASAGTPAAQNAAAAQVS